MLNHIDLVLCKTWQAVKLFQQFRCECVFTGFMSRDLRDFGVDPARQPNDLTLALGTGSVTPLQMAQAYATFANGGNRMRPMMALGIVEPGTPDRDRHGVVEILGHKTFMQVADPQMGILWMLATMFCFILLDTMMKYLMETYSLVQVTWARFFFATVIAVMCTIESTFAPCCKTLTGFLMPSTIGPMTSPSPSPPSNL